MATLLLVRHGETDANLAGRWQGHDDQPLNATGRAQAEAAVPRLLQLAPEAILSSDLTRARDTARPLAKALGLPIEERADLREIDVGSWVGLDRLEVAERDPAAAERHASGGTGWTDGETYEQLGVRIAGAIASLLATRDRDAHVAVFTHGGVIRAIAARALTISARTARLRLAPPVHAGLTTVSIRAGTWRLDAYNIPLADSPLQAAPPDERRERDDAAPSLDVH